MKLFRIGSFAELHECIQRYDQRFTVFRGVTDASHALIPKIGRPETRLKGKPRKVERAMLQLFKDRALPHLNFTPRNDWEWLALMQHHGAVTRMLDWTRNALVASYFAVEKEADADSAVYAWRSKERPADVGANTDPLATTVVEKYIPPHMSPRIIAQAGLFTVHPVPELPMESPTLEKMIIGNEFRKPLKDILFQYGIHRASLFPGLDGLADHISWMNVKSH